ncbi:MAG: GTP 3',8-cyclase MoaA, partial [Thermodesulfovibrionales bacterium]
ERYLSTDEIKQRISDIAPIKPLKLRSSGPARYYKFDDANGVIGFISPITHHFCQSCNRLRLTSNGKIRPCLFSDTEIDLKSVLRNHAGDDEIERLLRLATEIKPQGHRLDHHRDIRLLKPMSNIGG